MRTKTETAEVLYAEERIVTVDAAATISCTRC
jgi:hypothetical protein